MTEIPKQELRKYLNIHITTFNFIIKFKYCTLHVNLCAHVHTCMPLADLFSVVSLHSCRFLVGKRYPNTLLPSVEVVEVAVNGKEKLKKVVCELATKFVNNIETNFMFFLS